MSFYVPFQWKATPQAVPVLSRWMSGSQINEGPSLAATFMTPYRRSKSMGPKKNHQHVKDTVPGGEGVPFVMQD